MNNFWKKLHKPIYVLAPMAGITDSPWRQICKSHGADVVYSEMASATALVYNPKKTLELLRSKKKEAPYVVQLFGSKPEHFAKAVQLLTDKKQIKKLGVIGYRIPEGFDINFGCPVKKVLKQDAGSKLFQDLPLAKQVIKAVLENTGLPVSIKIRSKAGKISCIQFLKYMKGLDIKAVMIHGRSQTQGFSGPVDFEIIKQAKQVFNGIVIANGGVINLATAKELLRETKADGIGIARGAMGNPWLFKAIRDNKEIIKDKKQVMKMILKHAKLVKEYNNNFNEFKQHLLWYVAGLQGAKELRKDFIICNSLRDVEKVIKKY
ncbi:MAG: tRNA-dihydrouridine synthase [bacterium]